MKTTSKQKELLIVIKNYKIGKENKENAMKAAFRLMLDAEDALIKYYNMQVDPEEIKDITRNELVKILENDFKDYNEQKADFINWFTMRVNHRIINFVNSKRNKSESLDVNMKEVKNSQKIFPEYDFELKNRIYHEIYKILKEPIEQIIFIEFFIKETKMKELAKKTNKKLPFIKKLIENIKNKLKENTKLIKYYENFME